MYDSKKVYRFEMPYSCLHNKTVTQLHRFDAKPTIDDPWRGVIDGEIYSFRDNDPRLVEVDEVLCYINLYEDFDTSGYGLKHNTLDKAIRTRHRSSPVFGVLVKHVSGKVRFLSADATTDPEADQ